MVYYNTYFVMPEPYSRSLPDQHYDFANSNLGETESIRNDSIISIQQWIKENPTLNANDDPISILYFLRGCKFDIPKTNEKLKQFYTTRARVPEWFQDRNPNSQQMQELLELGVFLPLKFRDSQNRLVVIIRVAAHDPKKHSQDNVFKIGQMILDLALYLDETISIYGIVAIFDLENVTLSHALQLPPRMIKKTVDSWKSYPTMVKNLHFVNAPSFVNIVLDIFRRFMGKKLRERVIVHKQGLSSITDLPEECHKNPEVFLKDLSQYWKEQAELYQEWFIENNSTDLDPKPKD